MKNLMLTMTELEIIYIRNTVKEVVVICLKKQSFQ